MTTNETMLALHKMIGGVEWREARRKHALAWDKAECWVYVRPWGLAELATLHEAQNHICMAAIEWLKERYDTVLLEYQSADGWRVLCLKNKSLVPISGEGSNPLEALHAAVKAVIEGKEKTDGPA